jgi:hypothetical protein
MRPILAFVLAAAAAAGDPAPAPIALAGQPSGVSRNSNLWFEEGRLNGGQDSLQISLAAKLPERLRVIEVEDVVLIEAVGDDDRPIAVHEHGGGGGGGGELGQIDISITLAPPGMQVRTLKRIVLEARVLVAAEALRRATLKPAREWIAKRLAIEGLEGAEIELENLGAESLTLGMSPQLARAIENLTLVSADGSEIDSNGWSDSQEPGWLVRRIEAQLPADGGIRLDLRQQLATRVVRITADGIPIAMPDRAKAPAATLPTEPLGGPEGGGPAPLPMPLLPLPAPQKF